jgi:hypothetical protein
MEKHTLCRKMSEFGHLYSAYPALPGGSRRWEQSELAGLNSRQSTTMSPHVLLPLAVNSKSERKVDSLPLLGFEPAIFGLQMHVSLTAWPSPNFFFLFFLKFQTKRKYPIIFWVENYKCSRITPIVNIMFWNLSWSEYTPIYFDWNLQVLCILLKKFNLKRKTPLSISF